MTSVSARLRGQRGAHGARRSNERAPTVWPAALEGGTTRSRFSARSSLSCGLVEPARRWAESGAAMGREWQRSWGWWRRLALGGAANTAAHTALDDAICTRSTRSAAREQGTTCSRLGARSPPSCRLKEPARRWAVSSSGAGRGDVGRCSAARRWARASGMAGGARGKNDVLAVQRSLVVVVRARGAGAAMGG